MKIGNRNILWIAYILAGTDAGIVTGMAGLSAAAVITPLRDYNSDESFGTAVEKEGYIMERKENIISSVISIVLGLMLIIIKGDVISLAITLLGVAVLISAVVDFIDKLTNMGIVKAVVGVCILVFGWVFVNLALYILAAAIIIMGLLRITNIHKLVPVNLTLKEKLFVYAKPVAMVLAGVCLLFNQGGTIAWIFVLAGILLILEGVLELADAFKNK